VQRYPGFLALYFAALVAVARLAAPGAVAFRASSSGPVRLRVAGMRLDTTIPDPRVSPANLDRVSALSLGVPYGHDGNAHPHRLDCQTYVEHVLAKALTPSNADFEATLDRLRYRSGVAKPEERLVYPIPDWLEGTWPARDVTLDVAGQTAPQMKKVIDRARFFRRLELAHRGGYFARQEVQTPYIPIASAASKEYPDGAIVIFVQQRPGIVAAHCGFLFQRDGATWLRHASQTRRAVIQEPLAAYLQRAPSYVVGLKVLVPDTTRW
jgi:N-acetylmuramoyl-L-alanine amidase-like